MCWRSLVYLQNSAGETDNRPGWPLYSLSSPLLRILPGRQCVSGRQWCDCWKCRNLNKQIYRNTTNLVILASILRISMSRSKVVLFESWENDWIATLLPYNHHDGAYHITILPYLEVLFRDGIENLFDEIAQITVVSLHRRYLQTGKLCFTRKLSFTNQ